MRNCATCSTAPLCGAIGQMRREPVHQQHRPLPAIAARAAARRGAAVRLLLLTGCRLGEIRCLRRTDHVISALDEWLLGCRLRGDVCRGRVEARHRTPRDVVAQAFEYATYTVRLDVDAGREPRASAVVPARRAGHRSW